MVLIAKILLFCISFIFLIPLIISWRTMSWIKNQEGLQLLYNVSSSVLLQHSQKFGEFSLVSSLLQRLDTDKEKKHPPFLIAEAY